MSLLKKLFGNKSSESRIEKKTASSDFHLRAERVKLTPLHRIEFIFEQAELKDADIGVANISLTGLALILKNKNLKIEKSDRWVGRVRIKETLFPVTLAIRHIHYPVVGCQFSESIEAMNDAIRQYLELEILGVKLHQVKREYIKLDSRGDAYWFSDGGRNELYFTEQNHLINHFHLSFLGHYFEGGSGLSLGYGHLIEENPDMGIKPSATLTMAEGIDVELKMSAQKVIENIGELAGSQKAALTSFLSSKNS